MVVKLNRLQENWATHNLLAEKKQIPDNSGNHHRLLQATMMFQQILVINPNYTQATENLRLLQTISTQQ